MKDRLLNITEDFIEFKDNHEQVMHNWEDKIMLKKAEWVCGNGGDILELGFGMGISANYIQKHDINSHTICEIHPDIINRINEWKKDKNNVIVLEGDWYENIKNMGTYDGILFDTHRDLNYTYFFEELLYKIAKPNCKITWWNNFNGKENRDFKTHKNADCEVIEVNPPRNTYFNHKKYYMPKYVHP